MRIESKDEYEAAVARLEALGSDAIDGLNEQEYMDISAAMVDYETRRHTTSSQEFDGTSDQSGRSPMAPRMAIVRCDDDYERAVERIKELGDAEAGSPEEEELLSLIDAVEKWDARHQRDEID